MHLSIKKSLQNVRIFWWPEQVTSLASYVTGLEPATLSLEHSCSIQPRRSVEFIRGRGPDPNSDWASGLSWKFIHYMVARAGLEPATLSLEHSCSIQLSYRANM